MDSRQTFGKFPVNIEKWYGNVWNQSMSCQNQKHFYHLLYFLPSVFVILCTYHIFGIESKHHGELIEWLCAGVSKSISLMFSYICVCILSASRTYWISNKSFWYFYMYCAYIDNRHIESFGTSWHTFYWYKG